jgi:hypothetical protein
LISSLKVVVTDLRDISSFEPAPPPSNPTVNSYFEQDVLEAMMRVKTLWLKHEGQVSNLLKLAFLSCIETWSTHRRAGNGVKRKVPSRYRIDNQRAETWVASGMIEAIETIRGDLETTVISETPSLRLGTCLDETTFEGLEGVDLAVTSPPYPNCFDYSKIYLRELWLGDFFQQRDDHQDFRNRSVQSHVHSTWPERFRENGSKLVAEVIRPLLEKSPNWSNRIPSMIEGYFADMGQTLMNVNKVLRPGSVFSLVVGNAHYSGVPVPTDILLADMACGLGYSVERIDVQRLIVPSSQHVNSGSDLHFARESNVILRKE